MAKTKIGKIIKDERIIREVFKSYKDIQADDGDTFDTDVNKIIVGLQKAISLARADQKQKDIEKLEKLKKKYKITNSLDDGIGHSLTIETLNEAIANLKDVEA
ncbi:MAG: hypothetical protein ACREF7_03200 [Candidatus Saccharimonadales bacterium]